MINIEKYGLNVKVTCKYLNQFNGTVIHEIAHHLFTMNTKDYTIKMTIIYNKHKEYFNKHYGGSSTIKDIRNSEITDEAEKLKKILNEMFAMCSADYYSGTLDKTISDEIKESFGF